MGLFKLPKSGNIIEENALALFGQLCFCLPQPVYPALEIVERIRDLVLGLAHPLNRGEEFRPFFIIGSGRCGTTFLRRILQASPEALGLEGAAYVYRRNRNKPWPQVVTATLARSTSSRRISTRSAFHSMRSDAN